MSLQNINDPEAVKALLDSLRNTQAWTAAVGPSQAVQAQREVEPTTQPRRESGVPSSLSGPGPSLPSHGPGNNGAGPSSSSTTTFSVITPSSISGNSSSHCAPGPSVADLLSQLRAPQSLERPTSSTSTSNAFPEGNRRSPLPLDHTQNTPPVPPPQSASTHVAKPLLQDLRAISFQQALPHISQLMEDPHVVESLTKMKEEQDKLEKRLWEEREGIRRSYEEKVKVAKTKANMIGVGLSKHEAQALSDSFQKELRKFDAEQVLPAWDGLVRGQQARLEALKVPTMFVTTEAGDVEKQRRVVHVLEGILSTSDPAQ